MVNNNNKILKVIFKIMSVFQENVGCDMCEPYGTPGQMYACDVKTFSENAEDTLQNQNQNQVEVVVNDDKPKLSPAERLYERHLINVKKYQHKNPEKMKLKAKRYMEELKKDKEKYDLFLEKRRDYYTNVVKPKKEKKIVAAREALTVVSRAQGVRADMWTTETTDTR